MSEAVLSHTEKKLVRNSFEKIKSFTELPSLTRLQEMSYENFLQFGVALDSRNNIGIHSALKSTFPISVGNCTLEYIDYYFEDEKYDTIECIERGATYAVPLKVKFRLVVWNNDEDTGSKEVESIKEQDVYLSDIPLMTEDASFIVNGTKRVIVSQMHRSPGVFFDHDYGKTHASGKYLYSARIIPYHGSWLDLEFDAKDILYFRIDRRRKMYITTLLKALGLSNKEILHTFYKIDKISYCGKKQWSVKYNPETFKGKKLEFDLVNADNKEVLLEKGTKITARLNKKLLDAGLENYLVNSSELSGFYIANDIVDEETGEVLIVNGEELNEDNVNLMETLEVKEFSILHIDHINVGPYIRNTLFLDKNLTTEDALIEIYKVMRPGEPPVIEAAQALFKTLFFDYDRYNLSEVGRVKLNAKLGFDTKDDVTILNKEDIVGVIQYIINLKDTNGEVDDIDHLGNRRVRSVGELIENQFKLGLIRMSRSIVERMTSIELASAMPHDLINAKVLVAVIREFFGSFQLSQFMDQTNPLAEITHKRRLSALGPGGLSRDRAGFEVRDVHYTHYGRICPIETPEGPNIGLINSLSTYAKVNKYGFIETPLRKVLNGKVTDEVVYLSAIDEGGSIIAQASSELNKDGTFKHDLVTCRHKDDFVMVKPVEIHYIDISPKQLVSVATSLIPFVENDDANRALMGSNMQRQAVPLLKSEAPIVGTGMEKTVASNSGSNVISKRDGVVQKVDSNRIVIRSFDKDNNVAEVEIYNLLKYQRSNHGTCINQKPLVKVGDLIKKGDIIADGPSCNLGELALGRNVLVAFMPWNGYNFEDSILISERIVKDDVYTSIHIEEFEIVARDTRLGPEEITRDIPNIGEEALRHIDEVGIVHVGAEVKSGDILVGKVTPKSESPMTPEEKLLRAIFGEKAADVRDSSLRVPPGVKGTVVDVKIYSRRGVEKDERALLIERAEIDKLTKNRDDQISIIESHAKGVIKELLVGQKVISAPKNVKYDNILTEEAIDKCSFRQASQFVVDDNSIMSAIEDTKNKFEISKKHFESIFANKVSKLQTGDDLPQGSLKVVKVFVAMKHKLQPGDKMAGRHGNKGVISKIMSEEDMPYLADGTPVDIVLNPLGVPSRMNVGQILETHLGWAAVELGKQVSEMLEDWEENNYKEYANKIADLYTDESAQEGIKSLNKDQLKELAQNLTNGIPMATPVFDGAKEKDIVDMLKKANLNPSGQTKLIDGRTGEYFDRNITVGYIYMLKLHHLVDDKIHARSIGPYSLVTQQPLGGKSHFGGQRFGEMECWALQAYGASYTLQEMLTVKSDDVSGRVKIYESIIRGDNNFDSGIPESFHVMVKELRSLCLNVELQED